MEQVKILALYDNNDLVLLNAENERCENKFEATVKDADKKICQLKNGSFLLLSVNKKVVSKYVCTKSAPISTKHMRVQLNVIRLTNNEKIIIGGDKLGNVYVWSALSGLLLNSFQAHYGIVKDIIIDQIANVLYTYSDDNVVHVYNLPDLFRKKKINPLLRYQHSINATITQILSITPNVYGSYYSLMTLTTNGTLHVWGLKSNEPTHILKTHSENCTYICTNDPFNTHLYLCRENKIFRIPFSQFDQREEDSSAQVSQGVYHGERRAEEKLSAYGDYVEVKNGEQNAEIHQVQRNTSRKCESKVNFQNCTTFVGHKSQVIKCHVNNKRENMISLARDGIKIWDLFNCYAVKTLKYGENIIDFFIPFVGKQSINTSSYFMEFPHLLLECENDVKVHKVAPDLCEGSSYDGPLADRDENLLLQMETMFAGLED
ncbi:conserved Plasmodium protein, unknown function [Plasmodium knowlesi strain H]|uniref:Uncharacterized protein n=3 Tax=Plasmodium knowlesi TaxID=5850 RepID=A0A5K1VNA0_PLAKH|nr:WD repeat-containing protein, putative [Plasmodium knowlesi strain H]OTN64297.1 Uncharacterized protein PKNOH_S140268000 [Plasmodium knowlesi]CAA9991094.1 WD repeat-containing protein, putative [Plasmodium knowlesi strain H]SBO20605.1 conserved Plasmodium protein, unknown function [Plasmodium knowlesi strain H]SBO21009.1 conserved Plasmodium protein, unknown function [Plasmodium knowlesi strain H]VVS80568.1 WD repeat-containing protein, putative [Plasmodium knowlesi strain H]|eukprot:XP_002262377.1 hypothetical protein, conserved in Plasmodium species [Plasmodium knowlesi strain H]